MSMRGAIRLLAFAILLTLSGCPQMFVYVPGGADSLLPAQNPETSTPCVASCPCFRTVSVTGGSAAEIAGDSVVYRTDQLVSLTCQTSQSIIYYTTDGTDPDPYAAGARVFDPDRPLRTGGDGSTLVVTAIALAPQMYPSEVVRVAVSIDFLRASTPSISPPSGTYTADFQITLSSQDVGAEIWYTFSTTGPVPDPEPGDCELYDGPIAVAGDGTQAWVKAMAVVAQLKDSTVSHAEYLVQYPRSLFYLANNGSNNVSAYTIDNETGVLTQTAGSPYAAGTGPSAVSADSAGRFLYVANGGSDNVSAYVIDGQTGQLTQVSGSPYAAGSDLYSPTVDPTGRFYYVANPLPANTVTAFTINGATGQLTQAAGSPFATGSNPCSLLIDPTGKFLYVTPEASNAVGAFTIDGGTGQLTSVGQYPVSSWSPQGLAVDSAGRFLYSANFAGRDITGFTINGATGELTQMAAPYPTTGSTPWGMVIDPADKFLYVGGDANAVYAFTIDNVTGHLTPVAGSPYACPSFGSQTIDPTGRFLYVTSNSANNVRAFAIDGVTGQLTPVGGSPYPVGIAPINPSVDPSGRFLYVANNGSNNVSAFVIDGVTGQLTEMSGSPFAAGTGPTRSIIVHPL